MVIRQRSFFLAHVKGRYRKFKISYAYFKKQDRQCTYNVTLRRPRETTAAVGKQYVLHILSVFMALVTQHAKRIAPHYIVICSLSNSTVLFPRYLINGTILGKKVTEYNRMSVFISYTTCVRAVAHSTNKRYHECSLSLRVKQPLFLSDLMELKFSRMPKYQIS